MRILNESVNNLRRNRIITFATIASIALILVVFNVLITVNIITKNHIDKLTDKINLTVYLNETADEKSTNNLVTFVKNMPEVSEVIKLTKDDSLKLVERKYPDAVKFLKDYNLQNPLPGSIQIKTKSIESHEIINTRIAESTYRNLILKSEAKKEHNATVGIVVNNLIKIKNFTFQILLWMIATFIVAGSLIIFNAVKTTLHSRKSEIQIMQFVGATFQRIITPFILEGGILGTMGFLLNLVLITLMKSFMPFDDIQAVNMMPIYGLELLIAISIGVITSVHVVNKHLYSNVIYDN